MLEPQGDGRGQLIRGLHSPLGTRAGRHLGWPFGAGPEGLWAGVGVGAPTVGCSLKVHTLAMDGAVPILGTAGTKVGGRMDCEGQGRLELMVGRTWLWARGFIPGWLASSPHPQTGGLFHQAVLWEAPWGPGHSGPGHLGGWPGQGDNDQESSQPAGSLPSPPMQMLEGSGWAVSVSGASGAFHPGPHLLCGS